MSEINHRSSKIMKALALFMVIGPIICPDLVLAQGRGGYDQFGEYVEKSGINDEVVRKAEQNRLKEKLTTYLKKLENNPQDSLTHFLLGSLYAEMNRPEDAITTYKKALTISPWNGETHYNLARAYDAVKDGTNAIKHVKQAQKIFKENLYINWQTRSRQLLLQLQKQYGIQ